MPFGSISVSPLSLQMVEDMLAARGVIVTGDDPYVPNSGTVRSTGVGIHSRKRFHDVASQ